MSSDAWREVLEAHFSEAQLLILWTKLPRQKPGSEVALSDEQKRSVAGEMWTLVHKIVAEVGAALTVSTPEAQRLRWKLIQDFAKVELKLQGRGEASAPPDDEKMLTTAQAAEVLGYSRPHVSMLVDQGRLEGAVTSVGGHRRIPRASVMAYKKAHASGGSADYKQAARDAGIYDIPDEVYVRKLERKRQRKTATRKDPIRK